MFLMCVLRRDGFSPSDRHIKRERGQRESNQQTLKYHRPAAPVIISPHHRRSVDERQQNNFRMLMRSGLTPPRHYSRSILPFLSIFILSLLSLPFHPLQLITSPASRGEEIERDIYFMCVRFIGPDRGKFLPARLLLRRHFV
jgi:hypothetical protein